jgi:UDP-N-acetylmuramoyl-L-alanyl-D-glutamate--2,6-diaminopimelate ligase
MNPKKLVRKVVPKSAIKALEKTYRKSRGTAWQLRYGFPAKGMKVVAVTGTNGKSTTAAFINEVLKAGGYKTAMMTTPMIEIAGQKFPRTTTRTLEKQSEVQSLFSRARRAGVDWVVLEVPSHALDQDRIMGVKVDVAVITNLTPEHLDYHKSMENYASAKALLLSDYGAKVAVLNRDDEWFDFFAGRAKREVLSVGKGKQCDIRIADIKLNPEGSRATLQTKAGALRVTTALIGKFNLYNAAQAAAVGLALAMKPEDIISGIASLKAVAGRMEPVQTGQDFSVLIDYAVTPDSIQNALETLKELTKGQVRIVFGATGDRDKQKRPLMGEVAGTYADYVYLTDDETYTESSKDIIEQVYAGIEKANATKKTYVIPDRLEAIRRALSDAQPGDVVYITGLGHETGRNMGGRTIPWDDREVARKELSALKR